MHSPALHLEQQASFWESKWHQCNHELNLNLEALLQHIITEASSDMCHEFGVTELDEGAHRYAKDTKGIDMWTASTIRALPPEAECNMASTIQSHLGSH